jgi:formate C-acetyltransferase
MSANPMVHGTGGHLTMDFPTLLTKGFQGIKKEALSYMEKLDPLNGDDIEKSIFYRAVAECCDGMSEFGFRFFRLAREMAGNESDPARREELKRISSVCARVPAHPARNFCEALQSVWFAYIGILQEDYDRCCSLGRIDSYLYPFYKQDLENGDLTEERAQELLDCLWLKLAARNFINWGAYTKLIAGFPVQQQIPVGGQTPDGKDAANPLTLQCIQATMNTRLHQPSLSVRLHKDSPAELYRKAAELVRMGTGHPSFFNDEVVVPGLVGDGISIDDARDYSPVGCVGVQVSGCGKGSHNGGYLNVPAAFEFALTNGYWRHGQRVMSLQTGDPTEFSSFDEMFSAFEKQFRHIIQVLLGISLKAEYLHRQSTPTPYISSLTEGCLESGRDRTKGGARYNLGMSFRSVGLADVADSLAAIKKFVFEEKTISMVELLKALDDNFEGHEALRQTLLTRTPRYGNGNKYADDIARKVLWVLTDEFSRHKSYYGGAFQPGFGSVSAHWPFGAVLGAFPDGRKAGEPLTDGVSPAHRHDQNGPTDVLKSVGGMKHEKLSGGNILNLKFPPEVVKGGKGVNSLVSLLKSFVKLGVFHCQFNIFDAETMRDAQRNPENYRDLLVRVAGYSAYFTGLPKVLQDDIIARTEHYL